MKAKNKSSLSSAPSSKQKIGWNHIVSDIFLLERAATTQVKWIKCAQSFFGASNSGKLHVPADNQNLVEIQLRFSTHF